MWFQLGLYMKEEILREKYVYFYFLDLEGDII